MGINMKHEETSLNTKKALSASLKKHMNIKPLSKITVTEIITDCNVNRKTFYYHFEDIYSLLKWMLEQEAIEIVKQFDLLVDYEEAIAFVIDYVEVNNHILNCAYDSLGRDEMKRFLFNDFNDIVRIFIDGAEKELSLKVSDDFKLFLCGMYSEAIAGMIIEWFKGNKLRSKEKTIQYLSLVLRVSIPELLRNAPDIV